MLYCLLVKSGGHCGFYPIRKYCPAGLQIPAAYTDYCYYSRPDVARTIDPLLGRTAFQIPSLRSVDDLFNVGTNLASEAGCG